MVQESIPGGDEELYTVGSYIAADGAVLGLFSGRKLRQSPPGIGTCRVGEAVWVQEIVDAALRCSAPSTSTACRRWSSSATRATAGSSSWR